MAGLSAAVHGLRCRLPASGIEVELFPPSGHEDVLLLETGARELETALALASRLARGSDGAAVDFASLPASDLDAIIVRIRQMLLGDLVQAVVTCSRPGCGARLDLSFGLDGYLRHHSPRMPTGRGREIAACPDAPGWFRLAPLGAAEASVRFRLPTTADERAAADRPDAVEELARRCLDPAILPSRLRRAAEAAMEALAPLLAGELTGACRECGAAIRVHLAGRGYFLQELRARAASVLADIDALAERYHWSEQAILDLPSTRRARYAELARERGVA